MLNCKECPAPRIPSLAITGGCGSRKTFYVHMQMLEWENDKYQSYGRGDTESLGTYAVETGILHVRCNTTLNAKTPFINAPMYSFLVICASNARCHVD